MRPPAPRIKRLDIGFQRAEAVGRGGRLVGGDQMALFSNFLVAAAGFSSWFYISDSGLKPERAIIFASPDTRQVEGNIAKVWTWAVYEKRSNSGRESIKTLWENRCQSREQRTLMVVAYDHNGEVLASVPKATMWTPIVPDSVGVSIFELACLGKTKTMIPLPANQTPPQSAREAFKD